MHRELNRARLAFNRVRNDVQWTAPRTPARAAARARVRVAQERIARAMAAIGRLHRG
jgi:hypothetical protein